ncbi:MAG: LPS export ABC transporter permease LptG [Gammaproteobacteria bacterium]|jgi:lipopolysaccharide export system permease protein|nr:LPS export ABC transporter permease LptG [Gammaproteobacteria bacterium]MDP6617032.1 LPS export ABC transporter permease LptG [Gammaproteobacteria bacterium]MDP6695076.1 LPS export ABC transporter permease LptG [Gammaproteobacteria bacterium]
MRILNRYFFREIASSTGLVVLVLLSLGGFIDFISQLNDIGEGDYDFIMAVQYVLLKLPRLAVGLLPVSVLIGALLALGGMASHGEMIVMRAAGIPVERIARSVAMVGLCLAVVGGVVGEFMAPQMDLYARQMRAVAKSGNAEMTGASAWLRDGNTIFNLRPSIDGIDFGGVYVFRMGDKTTLSGIGRGDSVQAEDDAWSVTNYRESILGPERVTIETYIDRSQVEDLSDLLAITEVRESSLTATALWTYVQYLRSNGLNADRYEIAFWSRISTVVGVSIMCVLALPFVFGSLRSTGAGARMLIGMLIGVGYFFLSRTLADSGAVFELSPLLVAWFPTVLLAVVTLFALSRLR